MLKVFDLRPARAFTTGLIPLFSVWLTVAACGAPTQEAQTVPPGGIDTVSTTESMRSLPTETRESPSSPADSEKVEAAPSQPGPTSRLDLAARRLIDRALETGDEFSKAVREMGDSGNTGFVPVLVDLMRFRFYDGADSQLASALVKLTLGKGSATVQPQHLDWDWWVVWLGENPHIQAVDGYADWKSRLFAMADEAMGALIYQHVLSRIRLEEVVWGGVPKDGIPDLTDPPVLSAQEATFLNQGDRVFGVSFNGEHRAYPLRILNPHEMANDVVGGVPFALAY